MLRLFDELHVELWSGIADVQNACEFSGIFQLDFCHLANAADYSSAFQRFLFIFLAIAVRCRQFSCPPLLLT